MEKRQNEILEVALDRLEQEGMWFTTKEDKLYANAKDLYKLNKYGELEDKSKERLVAEVEQYFGDGAAFVIEAVEQWLQDNLVEGIIGYVDTLAMDFEIPEVVETIEAHDIQGVDDLDTTIAEEADLPEGVEREKKEEGKKVEAYYYNWKDDIIDVEADEANDDIWYAVAENIQENDPDYREWDVYEIMSDIISIWKIEKRSRLYDYLLKWYGSEENLLANVRDVLDTNDAIYFVTGCGYSIWSADLLGGKADGIAEREFDQFIANGCKKVEEKKSYEDYQEEIYYLEDIINDYEMKGRGDEKDYKRAARRLNSIKAKFDNEDGYYTENKKIEEGKKVYINKLKEELEQVLKKYMLSPEAGFEEEDNGPDKYGFNAHWKQYCGIDVKTDNDGDYLIYVNAELSYDSLLNLADMLNKVVTKYDKEAYFDAETPGRLVCLMPKSVVKNMTESNKLEEDNDRDFEAFSKYIMDNVYCDNETLMTTPEIIEDNANAIAEDAAKQVVTEILGETEYTGLYNSMLKDYEEEIKRIILNNIDRIVYLQNVEQEEVMKLIGEGKAKNLTEALHLVESNKVEEVRVHRTLQKGDVYQNENGVKLQIIDVSDDKSTVTFKFEDGEAYCVPMENANNMLHLNRYEKVEESKSDDMFYYEIYFDFSSESGKEGRDGFSMFFKSNENVTDYDDILNLAEKLGKFDEYDVSKYDMDFCEYAQQISKDEYKSATLEEGKSVNFNKRTKDKLEEGVRQRLDERNEQSAGIIEQALQSINENTSETESGIITKTSELFQQLSDRGYNVQVSFDNGESTSSIAIGQQGANILITITDPEQPLRAFASGNFEINDDSLKMIKSILEVL